MKKILPLPMLGIALFIGCGSPTPAYRINYQATQTPEEAGYRFHKITGDQDGINTARTNTEATWNDVADKLFVIDDNETKIAFKSVYRKDGSWKANMYVKNLKNLNIKQQRTYKDWVWSPGLSHDGTNLCFSDNRSGEVNLYMVNADQGSRIEQLTSTSINSEEPEFFPDNSKVLFSEYEVSGRKYNSSTQKYYNVYQPFLWSKDLKNGNLIQYGKGRQADFFPGKNSTQIACIRKGESNKELWILDLENGREFNLHVKDGFDINQPAVSPDGKKIAFVIKTIQNINGKSRSNFDIYTINADGTGLTQITFHQGSDYNPQWGKDSKTLYFISQRGSPNGSHNIWKIEMVD